MRNLRTVFAVALLGLRKWRSNPRIWISFLLPLLYLWSQLSPIRAFCISSGYCITPYIFPYLTANCYTVLILMIGLILLLCDAPFIDETCTAQLLRSGRRLWGMGQVLYLILASVLYTLVLILASVVFLIPCLEFQTGWGKVIATFAQVSGVYTQNIPIQFSFDIYNNFSAPAALLVSGLNFCLICILLGMLMLLLNMAVSGYAGPIAAALLVLWQMAVTQTWSWLVNVSPVSWVSLNKIDYLETSLYPSLKLIWPVTVAAVVVLGVLSLRQILKRDICAPVL